MQDASHCNNVQIPCLISRFSTLCIGLDSSQIPCLDFQKMIHLILNFIASELATETLFTGITEVNVTSKPISQDMECIGKVTRLPSQKNKYYMVEYKTSH